MKIGVIEGVTRTIGEEQGYLGLPLRDEWIICSVDGPGTPAMVTAWEPTPAELACLQAGAAVHLRVLGTVHPPVMVYVGPVPDVPAPDGAGERPTIKLSALLAKAACDVERLEAVGDLDRAETMRRLADFARVVGDFVRS